MAKQDMTREEILAAAVQIHLDEAWELREQQTALATKIKRNKQALLGERDLGHLTDDQLADVNELYPVTERATAAERVEKLRAQLAKAEERAAKDAGTEPDVPVDDAIADAA